jgi:hypothetical protein
MLIDSYVEKNARIEMKKSKLLNYLKLFTYSSPKILSKVLGLGLSGTYKTLKQFETLGLVKSYYFHEFRQKLWGITEKGIFNSWQEDEEIVAVRTFQPSRISVTHIQHELDIQIAYLASVQQNSWSNFTIGHDLKGRFDKRPDAIASSPNGDRVPWEIERTIKSRKRIQILISNYLQAIKRGEYQWVAYISPDKAFAERLKRVFLSIDKIPVQGQMISISEKHLSKFRFFALNDFPNHYL